MQTFEMCLLQYKHYQKETKNLLLSGIQIYFSLPMEKYTKDGKQKYLSA